jgi:hypothetical protein
METTELENHEKGGAVGCDNRQLHLAGLATTKKNPAVIKTAVY